MIPMHFPMPPMPVALDHKTASRLDAKNVTKIKMLDCTFYNSCLTAADREGWEGFGCTSCGAYQAIGPEQRESDWWQLTVLGQAADNLVDTGKVDRKRGVKQGAEAKGPKSTKRRLAVVSSSIDFLAEGSGVESVDDEDPAAA